MAPDCSDYPTRNEDRFRCYYTREYEAAAFREPAPELLAGLPGQLVQDREQYEVVFAEEFTGSYTPTAEQEDHCDRGLQPWTRASGTTAISCVAGRGRGTRRGHRANTWKTGTSILRPPENAAAISIAGVFSSRAMGMWKSATPSVRPARRNGRVGS